MGPSEWWSPRCGGGLQWLKNCGSTGHPGAEEFVLMISVVITPLSRSTWDGEAANLGLKPLGEEGEWQNWKMQSAVTRWWETQRNRRLKKKKKGEVIGKVAVCSSRRFLSYSDSEEVGCREGVASRGHGMWFHRSSLVLNRLWLFHVVNNWHSQTSNLLTPCSVHFILAAEI